MLAVLETLVPIFVIIMLGQGVRVYLRLDMVFWQGLEKLTYYLFTPCLLIGSMASKPLGELAWQKLFLTVTLTIVICALLLTLWQRFRQPFDLPSYTSVFQGGIRFNTFIALALTDALYGSEGMVIAALGSAAMIILINILCVSTFAWSNGKAASGVFRQLVKNPLILGCLIGLSLNVTGVGLPSSSGLLFDILGKPALPLGLLCVGAALNFAGLGQEKGIIASASFFQFVLKPVLAFSLASAFGLDSLTIVVVVILLAVPTAPSSYILSRQLGGNHQAMASIITIQTLLAFVTLPVTLLILSLSFPL